MITFPDGISENVKKTLDLLLALSNSFEAPAEKNTYPQVYGNKVNITVLNFSKVILHVAY